jgi:hypothetical protein
VGKKIKEPMGIVVTITRPNEFKVGDVVLRRTRKDAPPKRQDKEYRILRLWGGTEPMTGESVIAECVLLDGSIQTRKWINPDDPMSAEVHVLRANMYTLGD